MPIPAIGAALGALGSLASSAAASTATAIGTQAGRTALMQGAKELGKKGAKKVGEAAAQKVADLDPMDAAMSSLNASAERNRKADEEMRRRTADKASGQQSTTAGFGQ